MADPLSLLRQYNLNKKEIVEKEGNAIFGEFSWPKTVKTNYIIWGSGKDGATKEYYTLECLLFLLKNVHLSHPVYVRKATAENVPVVHLPDRKDLLSYLSQEGATSNSIDRSAPLEMPTQVKRATEESQETQVAKKPRIDGTDVEKAKAQLARRLEQPKETSLTLGSFKSISMTISAEKIAAMRAKRLAKKRGSIKAGADESLGGSSPLRTVLEIDLDVTKDICSRERQWRTRTSILQSSGKSFARNILALMESVKAREEGRIVPSRMGPPTSGVINTTTPRNIPAPTPPVVQAQPNYSRYLQEKFGKEGMAIFWIP
ncbi:unnamed protein product [Darwinula stevensoni]|uniref:Paf1 complex subunit Cdc73 N-terminal domain-containing protein n=1 Tax=Darwinula stevensoni TaxID=69355 RepID=A0A7R8XEG8_9CRUS|nr:unnamed protein product [Darwinula stevensoni]CAG0890605.1 unnamed protein product [Darwinula stevensoni]